MFRNEKEFQQRVNDLFSTCGWLVGHTWNSEHSPAGEPDCRLVHPKRGEIIIAELKMPGEFPTWEQIQWLNGYSRPVYHVYLWYPDNWDFILTLAQALSPISTTVYHDTHWVVIREMDESQLMIRRAEIVWQQKEAKRAIAKRRSKTKR